MPASLKDIALFKGLTPSELASVEACLKEKSFSKGEVLFMEGVECRKIFFVRSGRVKLYRLGPSGREQILQILNEGETCACNPGTTDWSCASTAEAMAPSSVWFLSASDYTRLLQNNPKLAHSLNRIFADRIRCLSSLVEEVSLKDSRLRLVKFLLDQVGKNPAAGPVELPMPYTREELAQRLGMTRETVERQLSQLKNRGLIDMEKRQIVIRDPAALGKLLA